MKQLYKCLTIVALVATLSSMLSYHKPTQIATKPIPKPAIKESVAPAPLPAPTPPPITYPAGCANYLPIVQQYDWNVSIAMAIMDAESGCNPGAVSDPSLNWNHVSDYGLFQLNGIPIMDPASNIDYAYHHKYAQGGWRHWTTYTSGKYLRYMP